VPFSADMTPSQMAKKLRQVSNIMYAMIANITRYAAIGDGRNVGAGSQVVQQVFGAAAQSDVAATALEQGIRQVIDPSRLPPPPGSGMGRA